MSTPNFLALLEGNNNYIGRLIAPGLKIAIHPDRVHIRLLAGRYLSKQDNTAVN